MYKRQAICGPLGPIEKTIFWDKLRTKDSSGPFAAEACVSVRIEPCLSVIRTVLNKTWTVAQVQTAVKNCNWATFGRAYFYDTSTNAWPICRTEFCAETMQNVTVPLTESELQPSTLKQMCCVHFKQSEWDSIVASVQRGATVDVDYKSVMIQSANPEVQGDYNLFEFACFRSEGPWFGYRALGDCTFSTFCGIRNAMHFSDDADYVINPNVELLNKKAGFGTLEQLYNPASLLEHFTYSECDIEAMPPAFRSNPFAMRDGPDDEDYKTPVKITADRDDDEQSNGEADPPGSQQSAGSNPLSDTTNERRGRLSGSCADTRPLKRRRVMADPPSTSRFIDDTAGASDEGDDQVSATCVSTHHTCVSTCH